MEYLDFLFHKKVLVGVLTLLGVIVWFKILAYILDANVWEVVWIVLQLFLYVVLTGSIIGGIVYVCSS